MSHTRCATTAGAGPSPATGTATVRATPVATPAPDVSVPVTMPSATTLPPRAVNSRSWSAPVNVAGRPIARGMWADPADSWSCLLRAGVPRAGPGSSARVASPAAQRARAHAIAQLERAREMARVAEPDLEHDLLHREKGPLQLGARVAEPQVAQVPRRRDAGLRPEEMNETGRRQIDAGRELGDAQRPGQLRAHPVDDGGDSGVHADRGFQAGCRVLEGSSLSCLSAQDRGLSPGRAPPLPPPPGCRQIVRAGRLG